MEDKNKCKELIGKIYVLHIKSKVALAENNMELLRKDRQGKEPNLVVKILVFFFVVCFSSCSIIRSKTKNNNVLGGYESSSYLNENDSHDSITISGIITEAKTKKKVPNAGIRFLDSEGNTLKKISSDSNGFFYTKLAKLAKFGNIEIDANNAGLLTIANIDFGIFVNNTKIKARLFKYDYSSTEQEFSKKEDRDQLKREIEEIKKQKR